MIGFGFGTVEVTISTSVGAVSRPPGDGGRLTTMKTATAPPRASSTTPTASIRRRLRIKRPRGGAIQCASRVTRPPSRMARLVAKYAPAALVAALLVATALAFVYTEKLKLDAEPDPRHEGRQGALARLRLRDGDGSDLVPAPQPRPDHGRRDRQERRHRADARPQRPDATRPHTLHWDGRAQNGEVVPEGSYKPRVHLVGEHRTIVLPNPMRVDVTPPHIRLVSLAPRVFSPDGDGRKERIIARYVIDEPAQALLYVNGIQRVRKRGQQEKGRIEWFGKVDGQSLPPGVYRISLGSRDVAGNLGPRTREKKILIRYVALGRDRIETVAGARFAVLVLSDAARVQWKLGQRTRHRPSRDVEAPRPVAAGPVHADRDRQRVQRPGSGDRAGTEAMTTLAQIAGPVGCAGLALLLVATRRDLRIAGPRGLGARPRRPRALPRARRLSAAPRRRRRCRARRDRRRRVAPDALPVPARVRDPGVPAGAAADHDRLGEGQPARCRSTRSCRCWRCLSPGSCSAAIRARASSARSRGRLPPSSSGRGSRSPGRST